MQKNRLVIVGAGPIGLEAAARAVGLGFDVTVLERGEIGDAVLRWKHVQLFTPFGMNSSEPGRSLITTQPLPASDELFNGEQFCDRYLRPLSTCEALNGRVLTHHEVVAVSRRSLGKSDRIGQPNRAEEPFRILVNTSKGETVFHADVLLDCSGFASRHRFVGAGGIACPGELPSLTDSHYCIPNIAGADGERYRGRHTLVIGSGYSAATSVSLLADLAGDDIATKVTWLTRGTHEFPLAGIPNDPLPVRAAITERANRLATDDDTPVDWKPGLHIEAIEKANSGFAVDVSTEDESGEGRADRIFCDNIIANPGFRPNTEPFQELQIHRCYATEGPIKLAAHLLGESSKDCLQQSAVGCELLQNPEPNFYILGAASYGRDSRFLLQAGLQQVDQLFEHIATAHEVTA